MPKWQKAELNSSKRQVACAFVCQWLTGFRKVKPGCDILYVLAVLVFLLAVVKQVVKHKGGLQALYHEVTNTDKKQLRSHFLTSVEKHQYRQAINILYQASRLSNKVDLKLALQDTPELHEYCDQLMQLGFSKEPAVQNALSKQQTVSLFEALIAKPGKSKWIKKFQFFVALNK